jgi:hypothetical protein
MMTPYYILNLLLCEHRISLGAINFSYSGLAVSSALSAVVFLLKYLVSNMCYTHHLVVLRSAVRTEKVTKLTFKILIASQYAGNISLLNGEVTTDEEKK